MSKLTSAINKAKKKLKDLKVGQHKNEFKVCESYQGDTHGALVIVLAENMSHSSTTEQDVGCST